MRQHKFTAQGWIHSVREGSCPTAPAWPGQALCTSRCYIPLCCHFTLLIQPVLWPPDAKTRLIEQDPDAGKD